MINKWWWWCRIVKKRMSRIYKFLTEKLTVNVGRCERKEHGAVVQILESRERRFAHWRHQMELHKVLGFSWRQSLPEIFSQNLSSSIRGTYHPGSLLNRNILTFLCYISHLITGFFGFVQNDIQTLLGQASSWSSSEVSRTVHIFITQLWSKWS